MSVTCVPELVSVTSVFEAAYHDARRHQWIESQRAHRDLGESAFLEWYRRWWVPFLRYRHVEHLLGERWWVEFDESTFGTLSDFNDSNDLASEIIEMYRNGKDNLDIIVWAQDCGRCMDSIFECLEIVNMNAARLYPPYL